MCPTKATPRPPTLSKQAGTRLKSTLGGGRERKNEIRIEFENKAFKDEGRTTEGDPKVMQSAQGAVMGRTRESPPSVAEGRGPGNVSGSSCPTKVSCLRPLVSRVDRMTEVQRGGVGWDTVLTSSGKLLQGPERARELGVPIPGWLWSRLSREGRDT